MLEELFLILNHPSGVAQPSLTDKALLSQLRREDELSKTPLLDFIIVGAETYWSAFEKADGGEYTLGASPSAL